VRHESAYKTKWEKALEKSGSNDNFSKNSKPWNSIIYRTNFSKWTSTSNHSPFKRPKTAKIKQESVIVNFKDSKIDHQLP